MRNIIQVDEKFLEEFFQIAVQSAVERATSKLKKEKEILNIKEASEFLNLSVQTIYTHTSRGTIPFFKKGKRLYFFQSKLREWLTQGDRNILHF